LQLLLEKSREVAFSWRSWREEKRRGGVRKVLTVPCASFWKEKKIIVTVSVLPFSWVILRPHYLAGPGSARRVALGMGWADTALAYSSSFFCSWVEYSLLQLLGLDGIDDLSGHLCMWWWLWRNGAVYEQTLFGGAREVGAAVVWMGSGFNSLEGGVKTLLFQ